MDERRLPARTKAAGVTIGVAHRAEFKQVGIAADDQIGPAIDREIDEFVVVRIATEADPLCDADRLRRHDDALDRIEKFRREFIPARALLDGKELRLPLP